MSKLYSLHSVTPDTGGIFTALENYDVPWAEDIDGSLLDLEYYGNISGDKAISPLVYKNLYCGKLTESKQQLIAGLIFKLYGANWAKEWATLSEQYDPIANYDMTEILSNDITRDTYGKSHTRTDNLTHRKTGTETQAPGVTVTTDESVYGFNSSSASPANHKTEVSSGNDTLTHNTTDSDTGTVTDADSGSDSRTRSYTLTRQGNIGVTSSQQLLQSERDLWMWNFMLDVVYPADFN